jgi:hypothetical protein
MRREESVFWVGYVEARLVIAFTQLRIEASLRIPFLCGVYPGPTRIKTSKPLRPRWPRAARPETRKSGHFFL